MIAYIRHPNTGEIVQTVNIVSYNLPLDTFQGDDGSVNITGSLNGDYSRYAFYIPEFKKCFKITSKSTGNGKESVINLSDDISLLESAIYIGTTTDYFTDIIGFTSIDGWGDPKLDVLQSNYAPELIRFDGSYDYIEMKNEEYDRVHMWLYELNIPVSEFETEDVGTTKSPKTLFYLENVFRVLKTYGCEFWFSMYEEDDYKEGELIRRNALLLSFGNLGFDSVIPVFFNDGHSELLSESYDDDICSCVILATGSTTKKPYYLKSDLTVSENKEDQIPGYTISKYISGGSISDVEDIFAENSYAHKIEFASDKKFRLGQPVKLILPSGILDTNISKVTMKSGDDRYHYVCGELPVTASDKIKSDEWKYCTRLPNNPRKGTLYIVPD